MRCRSSNTALARRAGARMKRAAAEIVVMKFGGSSLATDELRRTAVQRVKDEIEAGKQPVIVVSAIGRQPDPYSTDTLLGLAPGRVGANRDLLASCGESISAAIFASLLEAEGIPARAMTGAQAGIHTDKRHGDARVVRTDPLPVRARLSSGITPVIAGFQGISPDGAITTLGRGGSDLTAVALATALGNVRCEIFTDVDGVMTADPKRVAQAHTVGELTFEEADELAANGASVVHDRAARDGARREDVVFRARPALGRGHGHRRPIARSNRANRSAASQRSPATRSYTWCPKPPSCLAAGSRTRCARSRISASASTASMSIAPAFSSACPAATCTARACASKNCRSRCASRATARRSRSSAQACAARRA